ncbi:hypothetical protein Tco_0991225 [Tanacetum coccineum]|uniref:Uncharacterized protein n=1 Tax=Tanacetum coccineum TaxID=301880 RepID=A0ABQ5EYN0_9ASTR
MRNSFSSTCNNSTSSICLHYITCTSIPTAPITTDAPTITTVIPESDALTSVQLRVAKLEKDVSKLKKIDHSAEALTTLKSQVPTSAPEFSKIQKPTIDLEQESDKSASEICKIKREQAEKQKMPKYTIKSTNKAALKEYDLKSALYQTMHENKSFNKNPANYALYHALMVALIEDENAMDKGVVYIVKNHKRQHDDDNDDDDEDPLARPNQGKKTKRRRTKESEFSKKTSTTKETSKGKALTKGFKTGKSASAKKPVEEPIAEVVMDNAVNTAGEDVVYDDDQSQDMSEPKTYKTPNQDWEKRGFQPKRLAQGLEVGSIRRIQGLDTAYWGFLGVGTTFDIFQNIHILYLQYGVLTSSGYGVLSFIPLWSLVSAGTTTLYQSFC